MVKIYIVVDKIISEPNSWETHLASLLHGYVEASDMTDYVIEEITDLSVIKKYFEEYKITNEDKFIFPNAWTNATVYIRHWSELYKVTPTMIGFWSRGCYINDDYEFRPCGDRNWRKVFERSSFRCLDRSYFVSEYFKEQFRIYVSKFVFPERLSIMPFPLDYLSLETDAYKADFYKQDMIVFPWSKYSEFHEQIMYDFKRVFKNVQIIFAQENEPIPRYQLLNQLAKAKIAFLPYKAPNIGKEIYECILLGAIPLIPDVEGLEDFVPAEFRYPVEWTSSIFNYTIYAPELTAKIKDLIDNYDQYKAILDTQQEYLTNKYYTSEPIINLIFGK